MRDKDSSERFHKEVALQESRNIATLNAGVRKRARKLQADAMLTGLAKGLAGDLIQGTKSLAQGDPVIAAVLYRFDIDFINRQLFALNMGFLEEE